MNAAQVLAVLDQIGALGVRVWVDGGWGVDALIGEQTREHDDLDLVVDRDELDDVRATLLEAGFTVERDWLPTAIALRHPDGRAVDLHPVRLTTDGGGEQLLPDDGGTFRYAAPTSGSIAGRPVPCCDVATQVAAHLGYEPDADDLADMRRLADAFGLTPLPPYGDATASPPD
jgi:lincosamide nucleotidyltransferase A/C/D/E